jgi:peptidoglycan/LPS O-acetylase OafA/YrhL
LPAILASAIHWPASPLFRVLEWAPLRWVGRISYGLYLWQQLFLTPVSAVTLSAAAEVFLAHLTLTLPVGTASFRLCPHYFKPVSKQSLAALSEAIPSSIMEQ